MSAQAEILAVGQSAFFVTLVVCQLGNLLSTRRRRMPYFYKPKAPPLALQLQLEEVEVHANADEHSMAHDEGFGQTASVFFFPVRPVSRGIRRPGCIDVFTRSRFTFCLASPVHRRAPSLASTGPLPCSPPSLSSRSARRGSGS